MFFNQSYERNIKLSFIYEFLRIGSFLYLPVRVLFYTSLGFDLSKIFILEIVLSATTLITDIPLGVVSDRIGHKKSVLIGNILGSIGFLCILIFKDFYLHCLIMVLMGIAVTFISGATESLFYDSLIKTDKEKEFTKIKSKINFVAGIVPFFFLGGLLGEVDLYYPFWIALILNLSRVVIITFFKEVAENSVSRVNFKESVEHLKSSLLYFKKMPELLAVALMYVSIMSVCRPILLLIQGMMKDLDFQSVMFGVYQNGWNYAGLIFILFVPKFEKKIGVKTLVFTSLLSIPFFLMIIGYFNNPYSIAVVILIVMGIRVLFLYLLKMLNELIDSKIRASALSIVNTAGELLFLIMNLMITILIKSHTSATVIIYLGIFTLAMFSFVTANYFLKTRKQSLL